METDGHGKDRAGIDHLRHSALTGRVIGIFYQVHRELGFGFVESVYGSAMEIALRDEGLRAEREIELMARFRGQQIGRFRADFLVESTLLLELKVAPGISDQHRAQLLNYLRCTRVELGLILNFGQRATFKRLIFDNALKVL